jgi:Bacterial Alpha-2-macroglobulin MG10 domain/Alpha-2-macroglobulin family
MKTYIITSLLLLITIATQAQHLEQMIARDTNTTIFELDKYQLHRIVETNTIADTNWYYSHLIKKIHADSFQENKLPAGNYMITNFINSAVHYRLLQIIPYDITSSYIKKDVVLFITDKKTKALCKDAIITINNIAVPYDSGYGGYAIDKNKLLLTRNKTNPYRVDIRYQNKDYYLISSLQNQQKSYLSNAYNSNLSAGYLVMNKPVYKPNDTLKLKAFLVNNKNGNPICTKATLQISEPNSNFTFFKKLKPITPGAYVYEWVIPDTLDIDRTYNVNISYQFKGRTITKSETFYLEDYALAKNNFDVQITKPTCYEGEDISFTASATDANHFPLNGVQISYTLRLSSISNVLKDTLLIPQMYSASLFKKDTILPYDRVNIFTIPSSILPKADAQYSIEVIVTDPVTFEQKLFNLYVNKIRQAVNTLLYQSADSACIRVLYNNKDTAFTYQLLAMDNNDTLVNKKITTPYYQKLSANTTTIITIDAQKKMQQLPISFNALQIGRTKWNRKIDSVHFSFQYPFATPIYYKIFKDAILVQSGETNQLVYNGFDNSKSKYTLFFTQQLNHTIADHFYSITIEPPLHQLQIKSDLPETAFPGQKLIVHLQINDAQGNGMSKVNIASFAQNAQFGDRLQSPTILVPTEYYHLANVQTVPQETALNIYQSNIQNNYYIKPTHVAQFDLHKNEWYQLHFSAKQLHTITISTLNTQAEYCIVIEKNQALYTPKYVMANDEYVYINDINGAQKYSIYAHKDSVQNISVRYANYLLHLAPIRFASHTKTIIVIRADSLEYVKPLIATIKSIDTMSAFTPTQSEKEGMLKSIILTSGINFYDTICLQQNTKDTAFHTARIGALGTMRIGQDAFQLLGPVGKNTNPSITINRVQHNMAKGLQVNYFDIALQKITTRNYQKSITEQLFSFVETNMGIANVLYKMVADTIIPQPKKTNSMYNYDALNALQSKKDDNYMQQYEAGFNRKNISINIQNNNDSIYAKAVWIVSKREMKKSIYKNYIQRGGIVKMYASVLEQGADIYILLNNAQFIKLKNIQLNENDELYINPVLCKYAEIEIHDLDSALYIYNKITAIPMRAFYMQPKEIKANAIGVSNDKRKTIYIHGNVHDDNFRPIANAIILAEINGKYQFGAITNDKGEYEMMDIPSATYQFKIYANEYSITHILPQSYAEHHDYLLNISLSKSNEQAPVWESSHTDFRLMAFVRNETENKILVQAYDADMREPIENVLVSFVQNDQEKREKILGLDKEINFMKTDNRAILTIDKKGYQSLEIGGVRCVEGYYYVLDVFLKPQDGIMNKTKESYEVAMYGFTALTTISEVDNKNVKLSYYKKEKNAIGTWIEGRITKKGKAISEVLIEVFNSGILVGSEISNQFGRYEVKLNATGDFEVKISSKDLPTVNIEHLYLIGDNVAKLDIELDTENNKLSGISVKATKRKTLEINTSQMSSSVDAKKIEKMASTNAIDGASLSGGSYQTKSGEGIRIGGGRAENSLIVIDGIATRSASYATPMASISDVTVSAMPAYYGDDNGGIQFKTELRKNTEREDEKFANLLLDTTYNALRKNFTDVGYWQPNIITDKKGSAIFSITLPDNITTWRAHTMAMGSGFRHAVLTQNMAVYKPLQTLCVVPSFLYKGDKLDVKANFINLTSSTKRINTYIYLNEKNVMTDSIDLQKQLAKKYTIIASNTDTILWRAGLVYENSYKDAEQYAIPVYTSALSTFDNQSINLEEDSMYQLLIDPNTKGTITFNNNIYEKIMLYIDELGKYEYGCVEQTTSKLKALLFKQTILKSLGQKIDGEYAINILINKLKDLQNKQKTWGWWRDQYADWHITLYACDVLHTANANGYSNSVYIKAISEVENNLANMNDNDAMYALYILQKMNKESKAWQIKYASVDTKKLNVTAKMYYYKIRLNKNEKVSDADMYSILLEMKNNRSMNYERHFFYEPKADWFRAFLLFKNTKWENEMVARFKNELLSGAEKNLNTFTKSLLIEALVQKAGTSKANTINASVIINDTLTIKTFPYTMPIQSAVYNMKHIGASVFVNTAEAIVIDEPKKIDTLFNVNTNFSAAQIQAGKPVVFSVNIEAYRTANFVMVEIPIPSGMQIDEAQKKELSNNGQHIEFYKHKINVYYSDLYKGNHQLNFKLLPNFTGTFTLPATIASLMYYPYVYGCNSNKVVVVE